MIRELHRNLASRPESVATAYEYGKKKKTRHPVSSRHVLDPFVVQ